MRSRHPGRLRPSRTRRQATRIGAITVSGVLLFASACSLNDNEAGADAQSHHVRLVVSQTPSSLDACDSHQAANGPILIGNVTEALTTIDGGTSKASPALATEWSATGPATWRFKLRQGVKFQDGQPFDAAAVVAWMQRLIDPKVGCYNRGSVLNNNVVSATAVDQYTVDIGLAAPDQIFPVRMAFIDIAAPSKNPKAKAKEPIGTGPFKFVSWSPGSNLELTRYDGYWGKKPEVDRATYLFRAESSVRAAMATAREVDIATAIGPQDADMPGALNYTVTETMYLRSDLTVPPLNDIRVRRALNYAVDRQKFIDNIYRGHGKPASDIVVPTVIGHNPDVNWTYEPDKAKQLIAEAAAAGTPVKAPIQIFTERDTRGSNGTEAADTLSAMFKAVGLTTHVVTVEDTQAPMTAPENPAKEPGLVLYVHGNSYGDSSISMTSKLGCKGPQSRLCDKKFDAMLADAASATGDQRKQKLQAASKYIYENVVPFVPIAHMADTMVITNANLHYQPNPGTSDKLVLAEMTFGTGSR
ncbi:ABC transporter substrate-binding protein [Kribbella sp. NPDC058245]|uniref:ABC transporter substrate-binding protein n=1 Tax=Kribbella sp. NPDC058245 TaxID=3346399 RepID=UPI0036F118E7